MNISAIQRMSLIDYPDKISCIVFLTNCNFRCGYCHNSWLLEDSTNFVSEKIFLDFLKERVGLLDGVVVSGGEPTIQRGLPNFLRKIKELGFLVKLDTNGSNPEMLNHLIEQGLVDFVAMDIKTRKEDYNKLTRSIVDVGLVDECVNMLKEGLVDYEFRTTIIPGIIDEVVLLDIANWIGGGKIFVLQQFRPLSCYDKSFEELVPFKTKKLENFRIMMSPFFEKVTVRGIINEIK